MDTTQGGLHPDPLSKLLMDSRASVPPRHTAAKSEALHQASGLADTSTELMCAEAILDISKTILPAPMEGSDRPPSRNPLFCPQPMPPCSEGDTSNVDSEDSIEQEMCTFLALKAQVGSPQAAQGPLSSPGPGGQPGIPKAPLAKTPDLPLGCKRKWKGGGSTTVPKKIREGRESTQAGDHIQGKVQPGHDGWDPLRQSKITESPGGEIEAKDQPVTSRTVGLSDTHLSQGHGTLGKVSEKESAEDKSSSLDSDEDLDMVIKDLLRSKRKFKKRCRDPRASCKVRFGSTETRCGEKLSNLPGDWKDHRQQALRSCLPRCRGDNKDGPGRSPGSAFSSVAERAKLGGTGGEDETTTILPRRKSPEGAPPSKDTGASGHPPSASSPTSEDSAVDSDDSIELEIRFLAEKAKESIRNAEPQEGPAKPEMPCKKEPTLGLQPGVCTRIQKARGTSQLAEGRRGPERAQTHTTSLLSQTGRGIQPAEQATRLTWAALGRCEPALPTNTSRNSSAKASPPSRKSANVHKDHSPQGAQTAMAESVFGQLPSCAKVGAVAGSAGGTFHLNCGSQNLLTPNPGSQADLPLPWSDFAHQSRLSSPRVLNSGQGTVWTGSFGVRRKRGPHHRLGAFPASPWAPGRACLSSPPSSSTSGRMFLGGCKQAGLFSPSLGLPLQGPAFSAFRETQPGHSPVFGSPHLLMKDSGNWPSQKAQGTLRQQDRRNSGSEDKVLDLRYRHRVDREQQYQETLGSDASEFSDTSMEDRGSATVSSKGLRL